MLDMKKLAPCQLRNIAKGMENLSKASDFAVKVLERPQHTKKATVFAKPIGPNENIIFIEESNKPFIKIKK